MQVVRTQGKDLLIKAQQEINAFLERRKGQPILFCVSGGSALNLLDGIAIEFLTEQTTITVLDERYTRDPSISNFAQLTDRSFYREAIKKGCSFINTYPQPVETLEQLADRFNSSLKSWSKENPKGVGVATQGVGADGHTAGIFPYPHDPQLFEQLFNDPRRMAVGYDAGSKNQYPLRVTCTLPFLRNHIKYSIVYVQGGDKKMALSRVFESEGSLSVTPARILNEMKQVSLFTDIFV